MRLGKLLNEISKDWDTVAIEALAATPSVNNAKEEAAGATSPKSGDERNPDLPPHEQAGFALALCHRVMKELHRNDRGACVIVQWGRRGEEGAAAMQNGGSSSSSQASKAAAGGPLSRTLRDASQREVLRLTLAELDMSEKGR